MVSISEQVTPSVDHLSIPENCLDSLHSAERALIESGMVGEIGRLQSDMEALGKNLFVKPEVLGPDQEIVRGIARNHHRFSRDIKLADSQLDGVMSRESTIPQIMYTLTCSGEWELSRSEVREIKQDVLPKVIVNANPVALQISILDKNNMPTLKDFHHGKWNEPSGRVILDEAVEMIRNVFLGDSTRTGRNE